MSTEGGSRPDRRQGRSHRPMGPGPVAEMRPGSQGTGVGQDLLNDPPGGGCWLGGCGLASSLLAGPPPPGREGGRVAIFLSRPLGRTSFLDLDVGGWVRTWVVCLGRLYDKPDPRF